MQNHGALDHPLLPGLTVGGAWLQECVSSGQLTQWLRCILSKAPDADLAFVAAVRSLSCKATLLSWGARAGLSDKTLAFLGYHSHGLNMSNVGYRRDAPAGPLRELWQVVSSVKSGKFQPDVTRSGRWLEPGSPVSSASVVTSPPSSAERKQSDAPAAPDAAGTTVAVRVTPLRCLLTVMMEPSSWWPLLLTLSRTSWLLAATLWQGTRRTICCTSSVRRLVGCFVVAFCLIPFPFLRLMLVVGSFVAPASSVP